MPRCSPTGRAALAAGDLQAARSSYTRLTDPEQLASKANVAWGFNGIGIVGLLEGEPHVAVAAMEKAVLHDPDEPRFQGNLTRALKMAANFRPGEPAIAAVSSEKIVSDFHETAVLETHVERDVPEERAIKPPKEALAGTGGEAGLSDLGDVEEEAASALSAGDAPSWRSAFLVRGVDGEYLQVGAYADHDAAVAVASWLRTRTEHPVVVSELGRDDGEPLYRVRIGPVAADPPQSLLDLTTSEVE